MPVTLKIIKFQVRRFRRLGVSHRRLSLRLAVTRTRSSAATLRLTVTGAKRGPAPRRRGCRVPGGRRCRASLELACPIERLSLRCPICSLDGERYRDGTFRCLNLLSTVVAEDDAARPGTEPNQPGPWPPAPAGPAGRPRPAGVGPGASVTRMILTRSAGPVWVTVPGPQVLIPNRIMPRILGVGLRVLCD